MGKQLELFKVKETHSAAPGYCIGYDRRIASKAYLMPIDGFAEWHPFKIDLDTFPEYINEKRGRVQVKI